MGKSKKANKNTQTAQKQMKTLITVGVIFTVLIIGFVLIKANIEDESVMGAASGDLTILKSEVSETAKFYPYKANKAEIEVLAIKASDGTVRTAFNTCQVCYTSGRGYYKQDGNELVCQNCGNRFQPDQVEVIIEGCNPVPITEEYKTDDGENIVIQSEFLESNKYLFANWKK